jgi:hypothetical protein
MHWGDGFITNEEVIKAYGISDPSPLFSSGTFKKMGFLPKSWEVSPPQSLQVTGPAAALCARKHSMSLWHM